MLLNDITTKLLKHKAMVLIGLVSLLGVFQMPSVQAQSQDDIPLLFVEDDARTLEQNIKAFLDARTNWPVTLAYFGSGRSDAYLKIPFTLEGGKKIDIYVDSLSSAEQGKERRITIYGYFVINRVLETRQRTALLEVLNQHSIDNWMSQRLFLDNDNDIAFAWNINIPGEESPIHAEQVYDAIIRTKFSLDALIPKLKPLGLP